MRTLAGLGLATHRALPGRGRFVERAAALAHGSEHTGGRQGDTSLSVSSDRPAWPTPVRYLTRGLEAEGEDELEVNGSEQLGEHRVLWKDRGGSSTW